MKKYSFMFIMLFGVCCLLSNMPGFSSIAYAQDVWAAQDSSYQYYVATETIESLDDGFKVRVKQVSSANNSWSWCGYSFFNLKGYWTYKHWGENSDRPISGSSVAQGICNTALRYQ